MQVLNRLEWFHERQFLHRDMKPENILVGQGKKANIIYLIDFGLTKRYIEAKSGKHITFKENKGIIGTLKFLSLNGHMGNEHSRRDDLEAFGNILCYFLTKGNLPWDLPAPKETVIDMKDPNAYQN